MKVAVKRIYEKPSKTDGARILVDRLWPRGVSKRRAKLDLWLKDIAPTSALRKWFGHDPEKWAAFQKKYRAELKANKAVVVEIRKIAKRKNVTLLYAAKDEKHNEAVIIRGLIN